MIDDTKTPSSETIWWSLLVVFVHATASPAGIVTLAGLKAPGTIFTDVVAAELDAGSASTSAAAVRVNKRFNLDPSLACISLSLVADCR